jgi:transcriptional regulator with XRE-family HTH domain
MFMANERDDPASRVRERMKRWMDVTQVGQREFASDLKKTQVWLQKILSGENDVRLKDLDAVADAMRTTASELVRSEDERYQLELTPTEVRLLENLRRRPEAFAGLASLLRIPIGNPQLRPAMKPAGEEEPALKKRGK